MTKDPDLTELEDKLAEANAQIEALQSTAADAEARAATVRAELLAAREGEAALHAQISDAEAARELVAGELAGLRDETEGLRGMLRDAAGKYRTARLAAAPDVPAELVPELQTIDEIDREFEAAQRVVGSLRERLQQEALEERRSARVPAGSPGRRPQDLSSLSTTEKIRAGLQQLSEREGR